MMPRISKSMSIIMTLCLCMALLAPVLVVAPIDAAVGTTYETLLSNTIPPSTNSTTSVNLTSQVKVTVQSVGTLRQTAGGATYDTLTVQLPTGVQINPNALDNTATTGVFVTTPASVDGLTNPFVLGDFVASGISSTNTFEIRVFDSAGWGAAGMSDKGVFIVNFVGTGGVGAGQGLIVQDVAGDLTAGFRAPLSGSGFTSQDVVIAKVVSTASGTTAIAKSVKNLSDAGGQIDSIIIAENMPGVFQANDQINIKLGSGFEWNTTDCADATMVVAGGWGLNGSGNAALAAAVAGTNVWYTASIPDARTLRITLAAGYTPTNATSGRIVIGNVLGAANCFAGVNVVSLSKLGDVSASITSSNANVTEQDLVVAKYADYGVTVTEGTVENDVLAGRDAVKVGKFYIEETIPASLSQAKTIFLELPEGGLWNTNPTATVEKGNIVLAAGWTAVGTDRKVIKRSVQTSSTIAAKLTLENAKVDLDPSFEGDLKIKVYGSAGAEGDVKVATVKKPVKIEAVGDVPKVSIGAANQKVADLKITEFKKAAIMDVGGNNDIILQLDDAYKFASVPKVTVAEGGDVEITSTKLIGSDTQVRIRIKSSSMKASTIEVKDIYVTAFRNAPEGPIKIALRPAVTATGTVDGSTALDEGTAIVSAGTLFDKSMGNAVVADCVTPAAVEGTVGAATGQFRINSNIYEVNGVAKVMDSAPYIKSGRTFVPVRFLAYALGLTDADIVWDDSAKKATLTKGDNVVELTIGSTTITVNGEAKTMDVAPELSPEGRTMLPARFVAEGLGATVGWDPTTKTVLISK